MDQGLNFPKYFKSNLSPFLIHLKTPGLSVKSRKIIQSLIFILGEYSFPINQIFIAIIWDPKKGKIWWQYWEVSLTERSESLGLCFSLPVWLPCHYGLPYHWDTGLRSNNCGIKFMKLWAQNKHFQLLCIYIRYYFISMIKGKLI